MNKPIVAIVGKPNVGKSTFFNKVVGRRISIVEDTPGVTRDRIFADATWCGYAFTLVDTGGLDFEAKDEINQNILEQAGLAIEVADVIVETLKPVQEKYYEYLNNKSFLDEILLKGKQKAETKAKETVDRVYSKLGLVR